MMSGLFWSSYRNDIESSYGEALLSGLFHKYESHFKVNEERCIETFS